jgi:CRP-like cAMP-binding protein
MTRHLLTIRTFIERISPVDENSIKAFVEKSRIKTFAKKELFVREGDVCKGLLFIHSGLFRYYVIHDGNDFSKDFAVAGLNPFCTAFSSFTSKMPSEIFIEAMENSTVSMWDEPLVSALFENRLDWAVFARKLVALLYIRKERRELAFLRLTAQERYLQFRTDFPQLEQRVPQYVVASYLGITPESLSRIRHQLTQKT